MKLKGKIALITGGASGIGSAASRIFTQEGADVIMLDVNYEAGTAMEKEIGAKFIKCDISDPAEVAAAMEQVDKLYGRLDVLYNNASVFLGGRDGIITEVAEDVWNRVISINLNGMYHCCKYGIPLLLKAGGGAIINTASSAGVSGIPACAAYTATKGATVTLTRSLAVDYGRYNIRTNCIAPAAIETEMVKESNLNDPNFDNDFFLKQITPLRRWGKPEDVANLAVFLASDEGSYLNGTIIPCDGGITINGTVNKEA